MAQQEFEREDLMAEAKGLVDRAQFEVESFDEPIVVGFRADRSASFFFGQNEVYQFNRNLELRRGYAAGQLIKSESGRLVRIIRERSEQSVHLRTRPFSDWQTEEYLNQLQQRLTQLRAAILSGLQPIQQVTQDTSSNMAQMVLALLDDLLNAKFVVASSPGLH